jgi:hypothetical protein
MRYLDGSVRFGRHVGWLDLSEVEVLVCRLRSGSSAIDGLQLDVTVIMSARIIPAVP